MANYKYKFRAFSGLWPMYYGLGLGPFPALLMRVAFGKLIHEVVAKFCQWLSQPEKWLFPSSEMDNIFIGVKIIYWY